MRQRPDLEDVFLCCFKPFYRRKCRSPKLTFCVYVSWGIIVFCFRKNRWAQMFVYLPRAGVLVWVLKLRLNIIEKLMQKSPI